MWTVVFAVNKMVGDEITEFRWILFVTPPFLRSMSCAQRGLNGSALPSALACGFRALDQRNDAARQRDLQLPAIP
jgi:hypothetical protein